MLEPLDVRIARREHRALVSLRVVAGAAEAARERLGLAGPGRFGESDPASIPLGPGHWLLIGERAAAEALIGACAESLAGVAHLAVDQSAALLAWEVSGPQARELLARGTGLDLRPQRFAAGACARTRLAETAAIVRAIAAERFEVLVPRSYGAYFEAWLAAELS